MSCDIPDNSMDLDLLDKSPSFSSTCKACGVKLDVPWLRCTMCQPELDICSRCFSFGVEFAHHESDHPYTVVKFDFPLFEPSWNAVEEIRLLEAIQDQGLGNWKGVSARLRSKSADECERHYFHCYINNPSPPLPSDFHEPESNQKGAPVTFKLSDNPPRPREDSTLWAEMGGYYAARCDFNVEHDNFVEMDICNIRLDADGAKQNGGDESNEDGKEEERAEEDPETEALYKELCFTAVEIYRNCLKERQRRKKIVRDHGLINIRKWYGFFKRRYDQNISLDFLRPFMRLFPSETFDKFLESLLYEKCLKTDICKLQDYRQNGISRMHAIKTYQSLLTRRMNARPGRRLLNDILAHVKNEMACQAWLAKQASGSGNSSPDILNLPSTRKAAPPLYIEGLPGYEILTPEESEFCSTTRLVPQAFLDFSKILVNECRKHGFLKLAQARPLIKIDVNKTRKMYDFLLRNGRINKDPL